MRASPFVLLCALGAALLPASAVVAQTNGGDPAQQYQWIYSLRIDDQAFRSIGGSSGGAPMTVWGVRDFDRLLRERILRLRSNPSNTGIDTLFEGETREVRLLTLLLSLPDFRQFLGGPEISVLAELDPNRGGNPHVDVPRLTTVRDRLRHMLDGTGFDDAKRFIEHFKTLRMPEYYRRHLRQAEAELADGHAGSATQRAINEGVFLALLQEHVQRRIPAPELGAAHHAIGGNVPPLSTLSVALRAQADGSYAVSVPETVFSNGPGSYELGLQPFVAGTQGYTVFGRVDPSPANFEVVHATTALRAAARRSDAVANDTVEKRSFYRDDYLLHLYGMPAAGPGFADAFDRAAEAPRALIDGAYGRIEDRELFEGGGTFSKLFRLEALNDDSPGLRLAAGAHGLWQRDTAIALPLVGISFQDRVPNIQLPDDLERLYKDSGDQPSYRSMGLIRWHYQVGFNYLFGTTGGSGDRQELFFRYRIQPKNRYVSLSQWYANITDLTFSVSRTSRDDVVFEIKVAKAFGL